MNKTIVIENGIVYEETITESYNERIYKDREIKLTPDLVITQSSTSVEITGIIYKENYDGTPQLIELPISLFVNDPVNTVELSPIDGIVEVNLVFENMTIEEIETIQFKENNLIFEVFNPNEGA
jgi:hypothetical protein